MQTEFKSLNSYREFSASVTKKFRHLLESDALEFLEAVAHTSRKRLITMNKGKAVYRAQVDHAIEELATIPGPNQPPDGIEERIVACGEDRMRPFVDKAIEGRVNPKGVPVFYSASDEATAIHEMRPWVGAIVSVAQFSLKRSCRVVNCHDNYLGGDEFTTMLQYYRKKTTDPHEREKWNWHEIDEAFAYPVLRDDDHADYTPTQILAELFRREGFDGVAFKSSVGDGFNYAFFDPNGLEFISARVASIKHMQLTYDLEDWLY